MRWTLICFAFLTLDRAVRGSSVQAQRQLDRVVRPSASTWARAQDRLNDATIELIIQGFARRLPSKCFAGATVEGSGDGSGV
jgi:hypothetical protein